MAPAVAAIPRPVSEPVTLSARIAAGDTDAFRQLFDENFDRLYGFVYRYLPTGEAEDLVQEVFLRVWRCREALTGAMDLRGYLYVIARQRALDRLRHRTVEDRYLRARSRPDEPEVASSDPVTELEARELASEIQRAMDILPPRQLEVLRLRWHQHQSYQDIGLALGISPKTVAVHLSRAIAALRNSLRKFA